MSKFTLACFTRGCSNSLFLTFALHPPHRIPATSSSTVVPVPETAASSPSPSRREVEAAC